MATCPNCGEIVMEGDPYCSNCGTTLRWVSDEEDDKKYTISIFWQDLEIAKSSYEKGDYSMAFTFLFGASSHYDEMSTYEKRRLGKNPLKDDWVSDFLSKAFNTHNEDHVKDVNRMVEKHGYLFNSCWDCSLIYPISSTYCIKCGKLLEKPYMRRDPDKLRKEIDDILKDKFVDAYHRLIIVTRALELMESNGSHLEKIEDGFDGILTFVFKKEHHYFYTVYECWCELNNLRPERIFYDCNCYTNHDRLLQNPSFKKMVQKTEQKNNYTFLNCRGGYENVEFDFVTDNMRFTDRIKIYVRFRTEDGALAVYDLDLDKMELFDERIYHD